MSAEPKTPPHKSKRGTDTPPDERDATIARLERELAQERENSTALRATGEDLRFKLEVVEKGYLKQLSDARVRRDAAEQQVADKQTRLAALDAAMDETMQLLKATHEQLERLAADHDRLCKEVARREGILVQTTARAKDPENLLTIDDLLAAPAATRDRPKGGGHLTAQVTAPAEQPGIDMIAPDLVFTKGKGEDDDE
jgi:chromosome segregation ATPase